MTLSSKTGIPLDLLIPHLKEFVENWKANSNTEAEAMRWGSNRSSESWVKCETAYHYLAEECGLHESTILGFCSAEPGRLVHFDVADALLCAMDRVYLWQHEPLRDYYMNINLDYLDGLATVDGHKIKRKSKAA